jgi:hypothetical protein
MVVRCCGCGKVCQCRRSSFSELYRALVSSSHVGLVKSRLGGCWCDQPVLTVHIGKENLELRPGLIRKNTVLSFTYSLRERSCVQNE